MTFPQAGPWFDGEINAPLFEAALSWSRTRRSARLLLAALAALAEESRTLVFFEAPHRIAQSLADLAAAFGAARAAVVTRELTKVHETIYRGTLGELAQRALAEENFQRGEITIVVHGAVRAHRSVDPQLLKRTVTLLLKELPPGKAAALAAQLTGVRRSEAYLIAMRIAHEAEVADGAC